VSDFQRSLRRNPRLRILLGVSLLVNSVALASFFSLRLHSELVGSPQPRLIEGALLIVSGIGLAAMLCAIVMLIKNGGLSGRH
jgi:hypothetical protein